MKKTYVHCLNSTLTATTRTLCAILENFQTEEVCPSNMHHLFATILTQFQGVNIPEPLRKVRRRESRFSWFHADEFSTCLAPLHSSPSRNRPPRRRRSLSGNGLEWMRLVVPVSVAWVLVPLLSRP